MKNVAMSMLFNDVVVQKKLSGLDSVLETIKSHQRRQSAADPSSHRDASTLSQLKETFSATTKDKRKPSEGIAGKL